jgi:hypothetical protein
VTVDPGLPRKLGIRAGASVRLVNAPAGYAEALRASVPGAAVVLADASAVEEATGAGATQTVDLVHLFCATRAELDALAPAAIAAYRTGGHLWVSYPKGGAKAGTDLNRDARWSALRFRRLEEVGR